jgi:hypothetical protein
VCPGELALHRNFNSNEFVQCLPMAKTIVQESTLMAFLCRAVEACDMAGTYSHAL